MDFKIYAKDLPNQKFNIFGQHFWIAKKLTISEKIQDLALSFRNLWISENFSLFWLLLSPFTYAPDKYTKGLSHKILLVKQGWEGRGKTCT